MRIFHWTKESFSDEADLHRWIACHLAEQNAYGANLDALYDVLSSANDLVLSLSPDWDRNLGQRGVRIRRVLADAAKTNPNFSLLFCEPEDNAT